MKRLLDDYLQVLKIRNVLLMVLSSFLCSLAFYESVFTLFLQSRGLDYTEIFLLEAFLSIGIFVFELPSGVLADIMGRRWVIVTAMTCAFLSSIITALSHSFWGFALESVMAGIGIACLSGVDSALVYESLDAAGCRETADQAFALIHGAPAVAALFSLPAGSLMAEISLSLPVYAACIPAGLAVICGLLLRETYVHSKSFREKPAFQIRTGVSYLLTEKPQLLLFEILIALTFTAVLSLHYLEQPLFLSQGIEIRHFGWIMLGARTCMALAALLSPWIKARLGVGLSLLLTYLIPGFAFGLLAWSDGPGLTVVLIVVVFALPSVAAPIQRAFVSRQVVSTARATVLSLLGFVGSLVGMATKPMVGLLTDLDFRLVFPVLGTVLALSACGLFVVTRGIEMVAVDRGQSAASSGPSC